MRALVLAFGVLFTLVTHALAEERVVSFISDVTVNADASLMVLETITVFAEGTEIRRGILRDFPTVYTNRRGIRVVAGLDVLEVKRDGRPEAFALESIGNGMRVRIGDKDVLLDHGRHSYEISYRATRQLGFFDDFDELYWNVTGNGWTMPIEAARAIIRLPAGARIGQHAEYTGYQGGRGGDVRVVAASDNQYIAETTRLLAPAEGFTVAVGWQKGIVAPPSNADRWAWWLTDNAGLFALALGVLLTGGYYYHAWNKVGRDPEEGTVIPLFTPPPGLGPAGARFIRRLGLDDRGFAAAVVSLAVKGRLKIADDDGSFTVTKLSQPLKANAPPTASEMALLAALPAGSTALKQANNQAVRAARTALETALKTEYEGTIFLRNLPWFWKGLAISVATLLAAALLMPDGEGISGLFVAGFAGIWWGVILAVAAAAFKGLVSQRGFFRKLKSIVSLMIMVPFVGAGIVGPAALLFTDNGPGLYALIAGALLIGVMNVVFFYLLRAPTVPGQKLLDQIEGFRMYLATAEEDRLNVLHPPEKTPELFERYLPYALALDCENEWNAKFAAVLAAAAAAGAAAPLWYSGHNWDAGRSGSFTDSLGSSLASSVASASTAPGSSSGSSGGGSSGGGGGGGGGSGW